MSFSTETFPGGVRAGSALVCTSSREKPTLSPTQLLYITKLTVSNYNGSITTLNSITDSLEYFVTKFSLF